MNNEDVRQMLNRVYELEGLLGLASGSNSSRLIELTPLIAEKCRQLADMADDWERDLPLPHEEPAPAPQNEPEEEPQEEPIAPAAEEKPEESVEPTTEEPAAQPSRPTPPFTWPDEEPIVPIPPEPENFDDEMGKKEISHPQAEAPAEELPEEEENEPEAEENSDEIAEKRRDAIPSPRFTPPATPPASARLFSINDKFRFRREIFGNNADDFVQSLHIVDRMQSMEEAEDYFYNDLQLDPENSVVQEFMTIIARHFR